MPSSSTRASVSGSASILAQGMPRHMTGYSSPAGQLGGGDRLRWALRAARQAGGAIGGGIPLAMGAAVAAPGRRVINLEGDGSALYTVQALWTQAREMLDVTTIILSNRKYAILEVELAKTGANPGRTALDLFDLDRPALDWIRLAAGMGVEAARAETLEEFADLLAASYK